MNRVVIATIGAAFVMVCTGCATCGKDEHKAGSGSANASLALVTTDKGFRFPNTLGAAGVKFNTTVTQYIVAKGDGSASPAEVANYETVVGPVVSGTTTVTLFRTEPNMSLALGYSWQYGWWPLPRGKRVRGGIAGNFSAAVASSYGGMYKGGAIVSTDNTEDFVFFPVTTYPDASPALVVVLLQPNGTEGPDVTLNSGQYMRVWTVNNVLSYQVYDWSNTNPPANANTIVNKAISDANAVGMVAPPLLGVSSSP